MMYSQPSLIKRDVAGKGRGGLTPGVTLAILSLVLLAGLFLLALWQRPDARRSFDRHVELRVYCAASVASPVEAALHEYRQTYDVHVELARIGGSGQLLGQISAETETGVRRGADLYITADDDLLAVGQDKGIIAECIPMARQFPVIASRADRTLEVNGLTVLVQAEDGLRYGIARESAAIGRLARKIAEHHGIALPLVERCKMEVENVMQLAQALESGALDVAIVWDATVHQMNRQRDRPVLRVVAVLGPPETFSGEIAIGVVSSTAHPIEALRVATFLSARDGGLPHLADAGFQVVAGREWQAGSVGSIDRPHN